MTITKIRSTTALLAALLLAACGGSGGSNSAQTASQSNACDPSDPATAAECGTVLIGLTDADGDFMNYSVDVVQLTLETANGRTVEVLPQQTRVNFTDYVDLTELVTAASVPPATYVSGTISLNYDEAEVFVEAGNASKEAVVTDLEGAPLSQVELKIVLADS